MIGLDDWQAASENPAPYVASVVQMAKTEGWTGFNLDWEGKNTTSTKALFLNFCGLMNAFADGLAEHGLVFSTDIQARASLYSLFAAWPNAPSTRSERCQCFFLCCVLLLLLLGPAHPAENPARPDAKRPCRVSTVGHAVEWRAVDGA